MRLAVCGVARAAPRGGRQLGCQWRRPPGVALPLALPEPCCCLRAAASSSAPAQEPSALKDIKWSAAEVKELLRQVAEEGSLESALHGRLNGKPVAVAVEEDQEEEDGSESGTAEEHGDSDPRIECGVAEGLMAAELCSSTKVRDFVLLGKLAERMAPQLSVATPEMLLRLCDAYSKMATLSAPLFNAVAQALLICWPIASEGEGGRDPATAQIAAAARAFAAQRVRHQELFDRLAALLCAHGASQATPPEALCLLHSHAFLRLGGELGDFWDALEQQAMSPGLENLGMGPVTEMCYVLFLTRRADERLQDIERMLQAVAGQLLSAEEGFLASGGSGGPALHRRLLVLRMSLRYLHGDFYKSLPEEVIRAFKRVHRTELARDPWPMPHFLRKVSGVLTKMKIGHLAQVERGPFTIDIIERDRKLVYECNHFDRFYAGTTEKIASMCLQERIVKALGYRVVQIPHWQWNRIMHRKQRVEYLRMSRYYAIKDRRELSSRDEEPTDIATNELDYLGEYFFRKEMPSSHWSWFQPRVDPAYRLPPGIPRSDRPGGKPLWSAE